MADAASNTFSWYSGNIANGTISVGRVVVGVTGAANAKRVVQATTAGTIPPRGVSRNFSRRAVGDESPTDADKAALVDRVVSIYNPGEIGEADAGAAITDARQPLTFDNTGRLVTAAPSAGTTVWCCGWPVTTVAAANEKVFFIAVPPFPWTAPA